MVPTAVPSRILFFAEFTNELATFCPFFKLGVQKCSRTMFTRGEVLVKITFFRRDIVTVFAHEILLATFGYFLTRILIVRIGVGRHSLKMMDEVSL
jgi:hypothetical protein